MLDLNVNHRATGPIDRIVELRVCEIQIVHHCGCSAHWEQVGDDCVWCTMYDSPWRVCEEHRPILHDVRRPSTPGDDGTKGGYEWC